MADDDPITDEIPFAPVPSRTNRRDGWTEARQRAFIAALKRCASATAAARAVGKSVRGAYALRDREGADSFAEAWDLAVEMGRDSMRDCVIDRAMHGGWVPVVRRGRIVRMEFRHFDRMAIAILSGRGRDVEENRRDSERVREYRRELKREDREREKVRKAHEELVEKVRKEAEERPKKPRAEPRIRLL